MDEDLDFDDPETVMREARVRFIGAFAGRTRSLAILADAMALEDLRHDAAQLAARKMAHQMAGIAGTLGFPGVSGKASDLEQRIVVSSPGQTRMARTELSRAIAALQESFTSDLMRPEPDWATALDRAARPRVLVVDADDSERQLVAAALRAGGFLPECTDHAGDAFSRARIGHPVLVITNDAMPGAVALCQKIKASPDLAAIPVLFLSAGVVPVGRAMGPDAILQPPLDPSELIACVTSLTAGDADALEEDLLSYEAFAFAAQELLRRERISLTVVRLPDGPARTGTIANAVASSHFVARFGAGHLVSLVIDGAPALSPPRSLEALLAQADGGRMES